MNKDHQHNPGRLVKNGGICVECGEFVPNEQQHTPTPWKIIEVAQDKHFCITGDPKKNCWLVYRDDTEFVQRLGYFETLVQAELAQRAINAYGQEVRAVNSHEANVEALKTAYTYFNALANIPDKDGYVVAPDSMTRVVLRKMNEAIAKAESK